MHLYSLIPLLLFVAGGVRNISNQLTIRTKIDASSANLKEVAQSKGWWNPDKGDLDFAKVGNFCLNLIFLMPVLP